jgi:hypothetical protein
MNRQDRSVVGLGAALVLIVGVGLFRSLIGARRAGRTRGLKSFSAPNNRVTVGTRPSPWAAARKVPSQPVGRDFSLTAVAAERFLILHGRNSCPSVWLSPHDRREAKTWDAGGPASCGGRSHQSWLRPPHGRHPSRLIPVDDGGSCPRAPGRRTAPKHASHESPGALVFDCRRWRRALPAESPEGHLRQRAVKARMPPATRPRSGLNESARGKAGRKRRPKRKSRKRSK